MQVPGSAIFAWIALGLLVNPNMVEEGESSEEITSRPREDRSGWEIAASPTETRNDTRRVGAREDGVKRRRRVSGNNRKRAWLDKLRSD